MLQTGLGASVFANGYTNMASKGTNANASPQGPRTATQAGFGTVAGGGGSTKKTLGVLSTGAIALAALIWIWWSLPR